METPEYNCILLISKLPRSIAYIKDWLVLPLPLVERESLRNTKKLGIFKLILRKNVFRSRHD